MKRMRALLILVLAGLAAGQIPDTHRTDGFLNCRYWNAIENPSMQVGIVMAVTAGNNGEYSITSWQSARKNPLPAQYLVRLLARLARYNEALEVALAYFSAHALHRTGVSSGHGTLLSCQAVRPPEGTRARTRRSVELHRRQPGGPALHAPGEVGQCKSSRHTALVLNPVEADLLFLERRQGHIQSVHEDRGGAKDETAEL